MNFQLISLRDANQNFSRLIAAVERGEAFCITRRGLEVARLTPSPLESLSGPQGRLAADKAAGDGALGERVRQLEARLDKLASALLPTDQR